MPSLRTLALAGLLALASAAPAAAAHGDPDTGFGAAEGVGLPGPVTAVATRADGLVFAVAGSQLVPAAVVFRAGTARVRVRLNRGSRLALAKQRSVEVGIRYEAKAGGTTRVIDRQLILRG